MNEFTVLPSLFIALASTKSKSATKYLSPTLVVKATLHGKWTWRSHGTTIHVTYGKPNYAERLFVKKCIKAGVKFPVTKIQFKPEVK